jgi:hypothetical protein
MTDYVDNFRDTRCDIQRFAEERAWRIDFPEGSQMRSFFWRDKKLRGDE